MNVRIRVRVGLEWRHPLDPHVRHLINGHLARVGAWVGFRGGGQYTGIGSTCGDNRRRWKWPARAPEAIAGRPAAGPHTGRTKLPRAIRRTLRRRRSRAVALPRGRHFEHAGRSGAGKVTVLWRDLGAVGELAGAEGDVERARAHVDVTPAGGRGRVRGRAAECGGVPRWQPVGEARERRGREGELERARVRASEAGRGGAKGPVCGPGRHAGSANVVGE